MAVEAEVAPRDSKYSIEKRDLPPGSLSLLHNARVGLNIGCHPSADGLQGGALTAFVFFAFPLLLRSQVVALSFGLLLILPLLALAILACPFVFWDVFEVSFDAGTMELSVD